MGAPCLEMDYKDHTAETLVRCLFDILGSKKIATAESCTGGMIAMYVTAEAGSSKFFERGFVTYSNEAKSGQLGVNAANIKQYGAVSAEIAAEMAQGAIKNSEADIAVSVTGIAGPDGGTDEKPVGLVYIGIHDKLTNETQCFKHVFSGDRTEIRQRTAVTALRHLLLKAEKLQKIS
jgi:nicotinamide-nucleotide amidase